MTQTDDPIRFGAAPFGEKRDPRRIDAVIEELRRLWRRHPDTRLSQLVYNAVRQQRDVPPCPELFYAEDDVTLAGIREYGKP